MKLPWCGWNKKLKIEKHILYTVGSHHYQYRGLSPTAQSVEKCLIQYLLYKFYADIEIFCNFFDAFASGIHLFD